MKNFVSTWLSGSAPRYCREEDQSYNISHGERRKCKKSQKLVDLRLITRPIILLDEVILFNFVTLIAGVGVSNSEIQSQLSSRLLDYRR